MLLTRHLFRRYLSPDGDANAAIPSTPSPTRRRRIADAAPDFARLAKDVAAAFGATVQSRLDTGALRPGYTFTLDELDNKMGEGLPEVKVYIAGKYKKAGAEAQYPRFGLVHRHNAWILPTDHDELKLALASMVKSLGEDGFTSQEYGLQYWSDIQTAFGHAMDAALANDQNVSKLVGDKNTGRAYLNKVLVAVPHLLQANYPDTYEAEARVWGFEKENN